MSACLPIDELEKLAADAAADADAARHLATCPRCRRRAAALRANNALLGAVHLAVRDTPALAAHTPAAELRIPGYEILAEVHRGGQGIVYAALQHSTRRQVALKVMKEGPFAGAADKARFDREVGILSQLRHPNIVAIHDSGVAAGHSYFVMDYIAGGPLDEYVRTRGDATTADVLRLFATICDAVNAAHVRGIIHRDLKPSNIRVDEQGKPHVLDFGLAKLTTIDGGTDLTQMTNAGQFIGSLPWASPEQAEGEPQKIDLRTDVYALGVLLYQLLAGRFPYSVSGSAHEVLSRILHEEPPRPSAVCPPGRRLDGDLDTIILKCLAKERDRRYQSAGELGRDLQRYLAGQPIDARRDSTWYMLTKTVKRYRGAFTLIAVAACVLPGFTIALAVAYRQTARAEQAVSRRSAELAELLAESNVDRGRLMVLAGNIPVAERLLWHEFLTHEGDTVAGRQAYWGLWELYSQQPCVATLRAAQGISFVTCFVPDRPELVVLTDEGVCERWSLVDFQRLASTALARGIPERPFLHALSPDATLALVRDQRGVTLWDIAGDTPVHKMDWNDPIPRRVTFAPDMRWLAVESGCIRFYRLPECEPCGEIPASGGAFCAFSFASHGETFATLTTDRVLGVWSVPDGRLMRALQVGELVAWNDSVSLSVSDDDHYLAAWLGDRLQLWDFHSLRADRTLGGGVGQSGMLRFNPDGRSLAACGSEESRVLVWNVESDAPARLLLGHRVPVNNIAYSADGRYLASTSRDGAIRVWELGTPGMAARIDHTTTISDVAFGAADSEVLAAAADGRVWSSDARTGAAIREYRGHTRTVNHVALSPDGRRVAASAADGTVRVWDHAAGQTEFVFDTKDHRADARWSWPEHAHPHQANRIVFHPAGRLLACAGEDGNVSLWDCETATCAAVLAAHRGRVPDVDFSPDGHKLASISYDEQLILWDVATHQMIRAVRAHPSGGRTLAFSPDGRTIATGGDDACIRLWDVETGVCLKTLEGHQQDVFSVRFSPDGRLLASGERSGTIEGGRFPVFLWDVASGRNLAMLPGHTNHVLAVAFSSDSRYLASCGSDRSVLVRDLTHFDRHIAGNLNEALHHAPDVSESSPRAIELRAWARDVLARTAPDRS